MKRLKIILLPGFDGTGKMFEPLLSYLPASLTPEIISLSKDGSQSYSELLNFVEKKLPKDEEFILLAESFSGPLAVEIAASKFKNLKGLILCATFLSSPYYLPKILRPLISSLVFKLPVPGIILKYFLLGLNCQPELVALMRDSLSLTAPATLASRLKAIFDVDVTSLMSQIAVPMLYMLPTNDQIISPISSESIKIFGVRVVQISGPHCILQAEPEESANRINEFCTTLYDNE